MWEIEYDDIYMETLHDFNFDISSDLFRKWKHSGINEEWKDIEIPEEYGYLFDYQKDALRFSIYFKNRVALVLEMGGGKSVTSLALMDIKERFPVLIVCPQIVKVNWKNEYKKFINKGDKIKIIESSAEMLNYNNEYDIYIINYELIARHMKKIKKKKNAGYTFLPDRTLNLFKRNGFKFAIIDEIHKIKNMESQTKNGVHYLCETIPSILALTGTPILTSSKDLFPILNLLRPDLFPNYWSFINRYCFSRMEKGEKRYYGARNNEELNHLLINNIMFRKTKEEMGKTGDKPLVSVIPIKLKDRKYYDELEDKGNDLKDSENKNKKFEHSNNLRKEIWEQKKEGVFEFIDEALEESDRKFVIFAHNKKVIDDIVNRYNKIAVKIDGSVSTNGDVRQNIIDGFVKSKTLRLFIGSLEAFSTGANGIQYGCSDVILVQWPYVFATLDQAISRVDRTGQKNRVNVFHLPGENTTEEDLLKLMDRRANMSKEVVDNMSLEESDMLTTLLKMSKRRSRRKRATSRNILV